MLGHQPIAIGEQAFLLQQLLIMRIVVNTGAIELSSFVNLCLG